MSEAAMALLELRQSFGHNTGDDEFVLALADLNALKNLNSDSFEDIVKSFKMKHIFGIFAIKRGNEEYIVYSIKKDICYRILGIYASFIVEKNGKFVTFLFLDKRLEGKTQFTDGTKTIFLTKEEEELCISYQNEH